VGLLQGADELQFGYAEATLNQDVRPKNKKTFDLAKFTDKEVVVEDESVIQQMPPFRRAIRKFRIAFSNLFVQPIDSADYAINSGDANEFTICGKRAESGILVYRIVGSFSYVNCERHNRRLKTFDNVPSIVISLRHMFYCDLDALDILEECCKELQHRGQTVVLSSISPRVLPLLEKSDIFNEMQQKGCVFKTTREALQFLSTHGNSSHPVEMSIGSSGGGFPPVVDILHDTQHEDQTHIQ
jgi:anti-anti-sigma regulatory factor